MRYKPSLIDPAEREQYAAEVFAWLHAAKQAYSPTADKKAQPPAFQYGPISIELAPLDKALQGRYRYAELQYRLHKIASALLMEARPADRKRLREMRKQEQAEAN